MGSKELFPEGSPPTPEVSIVMPCLNEAGTLEQCIQIARSALEKYDLSGEIIVADNGSTDGSDRIAQAAGARLVRVQERGYGAALMGGIREARGTFIVMGDADESYDFEAIAPFIEKLREGYDLVMGCRLPRGGGVIMPGAMPWTHRWIGNPVLSTLGRLFFLCPVTDFHCGLRAFSRHCYETLDLRTTGMEFASEMVIKATLKGLRIAELPITLYKDGRDRPPHLKSWRDGWRHLRFMLLYSPRWLFLVPGFTLLIGGALAGGVLLRGPVTILGIGFDTNTLLVASMAVLVGFKLIAFAVFSKIFAITEGLLPEDPHLLNRLFQWFRLETGLFLGIGVSLLGVALLSWGILYWYQNDFGPMSYPDSLRLVIPGVLGLTLGIEIIFSSFFLSLLGLSRR